MKKKLLLASPALNKFTKVVFDKILFPINYVRKKFYSYPDRLFEMGKIREY
jgi:hypothetical protein